LGVVVWRGDKAGCPGIGRNGESSPDERGKWQLLKIVCVFSGYVIVTLKSTYNAASFFA
jgi:hypothetical protein